jgi:selenocysteine lyase/cysteine desulfurase
MANGTTATFQPTATAAEAARSLFAPAPGTTYLDAASYGLPPRPTVEALQGAVLAWQSGRARWLPDWDVLGEECRASYAALIGAAAAEIALVPTVSVGVATVAASLQAGQEALIPADEFTSVGFPFLVAAERRGVVVREAPFDELPAAIGPETRLVAFSLVRSQDGRVAPLDAILAAAERHGTRVLVDATHAIPLVDIAAELPRIDYLICHGYKHLLCPRGVGFLYVRRDRWDEAPPIHANWRAASPIYARSYGGALAPAEGAARFDVSLDWFAWVGARPSLDLLVEWRAAGVLRQPLALAADLAARLNLPAPGASIVAVPVSDAPAALAALDEQGIRAAAPGGKVRLSTHVWNTPEEIARAADAVRPFLTPER